MFESLRQNAFRTYISHCKIFYGAGWFSVLWSFVVVCEIVIVVAVVVVVLKVSHTNSTVNMREDCTYRCFCAVG